MHTLSGTIECPIQAKSFLKIIISYVFPLLFVRLAQLLFTARIERRLAAGVHWNP